MSAVLMVESWLQSTGLRIPQILADRGIDFVLLTRDPSLYTLEGGKKHPVIADAAEIVTIETNDDAATITAAQQVAKRYAATGNPIQGVLTTCDYYLPTVAAVAQALHLPAAPVTAMRTATRKHLVRSALADANIPDVPHKTATTWEGARKAASQMGYPVVVKPVDMNSGTGVRRVVDEQELADAFAQITAHEFNTRGQHLEQIMLIEQVLEGPEYSVEAFTFHGTTTIIGVTAKSVADVDGAYIEAGHIFPALLDSNTQDAVEQHVIATLNAIGYSHGVSHTEVRITAGGPRLVEFNPRQGGGYIFDLVQLVTGLNPLDAVVDLALGHEPAARIKPQAASAAVSFVLPHGRASNNAESPIPAGHATRSDDGAEGTSSWGQENCQVVSYDLPAPQPTAPARDNNNRCGHIIAMGPNGHAAKHLCDHLVRTLRPTDTSTQHRSVQKTSG